METVHERFEQLEDADLGNRLVELSFERLSGPDARRALREQREDAFEDLRRRLARERARENSIRLASREEEADVAPCQLVRFPRAGGRRDDLVRSLVRMEAHDVRSSSRVSTVAGESPYWSSW